MRSNISVIVLLRENLNYVNGTEVIEEGPAVGQMSILSIIQLSGTNDTELGILNVGTLRCSVGEVG